jgi:hypothetical protein
MIKTGSLSLANAQNISQISNSAHSSSMLAVQNSNNNSDFGELLSLLSSQMNQKSSIKSGEDSGNKNSQLSLEASLYNTDLKNLDTKFINDILEYLESKVAIYQHSKSLALDTSEDSNKDSSKNKISMPYYTNTAQLIALINSIISGKSDIDNSSIIKEDPLKTKINLQNENDQNKSTESKTSTQQNPSSNNSLNQTTTTNQKTNTFDIKSPIYLENNQLKDNNTLNSAALNTRSNLLPENTKISTENIANDPSQNKYIQNSEAKSFSYKPENQSPKTLNLDTNTNYDPQAQNDNISPANAKYSRTMQESVLSYKLYDNKSNAQKTNFDNITQKLLQNASDKINIDPKSLQQADQNTTQLTPLLLKIAQESKEAQGTFQDKTTTNSIDSTIKNQQQETLNLQTNSSQPQAKENVGLSSNIQTIIDKIAELKNLNPPVITSISSFFLM